MFIPVLPLQETEAMRRAAKTRLRQRMKSDIRLLLDDVREWGRRNAARPCFRLCVAPFCRPKRPSFRTALLLILFSRPFFSWHDCLFPLSGL